MNLKKWLKKHMKCLPNTIKAINFNIYESFDCYQLELIGCNKYDTLNEDWPNDYIYASDDDRFEFSASDDWLEALNVITTEVKKNLAEISPISELVEKGIEYITIGFIDGDLEVIYQNLV